MIKPFFETNSIFSQKAHFFLVERYFRLTGYTLSLFDHFSVEVTYEYLQQLVSFGWRRKFEKIT